MERVRLFFNACKRWFTRKVFCTVYVEEAYLAIRKKPYNRLLWDTTEITPLEYDHFFIDVTEAVKNSVANTGKVLMVYGNSHRAILVIRYRFRMRHWIAVYDQMDSMSSFPPHPKYAKVYKGLLKPVVVEGPETLKCLVNELGGPQRCLRISREAFALTCHIFGAEKGTVKNQYGECITLV